MHDVVIVGYGAIHKLRNKTIGGRRRELLLRLDANRMQNGNFGVTDGDRKRK